MKKWEHAENYMGTTYHDWYVFLGQSRDSGPLDQSNFECGLHELGGESETVIVARSTHWLCGWVEAILVHESDEYHINQANDMLDELEQHPVLDEEDFSRREAEEHQEE